MSLSAQFAAASAVCVMFASTAFAGPEWVEQGDAGSLPSDAQAVTVPTNVTKIRGTLVGSGTGFGPGADVADAYLIQIDQPTTFFASTVPLFGGSAQFDTQLWLMDMDGFGLLGNNDTVILTAAGGGFFEGSTLNNFSTDGTEIIINKPGLYLLCISNVFTDPYSTTGPIYNFTSSGEVSGPDGAGGDDPVTQWLFFPPGDGVFFGEYEIALSGVVGVPSTEQLVAVDIKPGGCPNSFNRNSNGVLPVSVLGSSTFNVQNIVLSTVRISRADNIGGNLAPHNGPPGPHATYEDNGTPFVGPECDCHALNGDGFMDLSLKFKSSNLVQALQLNDLPAGALVKLKVTGELSDSTTFVGYDCIRLVPPGTPPGLVTVRSSVFEGWVGMTPLDLQLDGGGFGKFNRTYPQGTVTTLTAPAVPGQTFLGWRINGTKPLQTGATLTFTITGATQSIEAVYGAQNSVTTVQ